MAGLVSGAPADPELNSESVDLELRPDRFFNRELSWLAFNERVFAQASNNAHPLLERVKFLAISAANLEEFFMVRVAGLVAQVSNKVETAPADGMTPAQQISAITEAASKIAQNQSAKWQELQQDLRDKGINLMHPSDIPESKQKWLAHYFETQVIPVLTPIAVDTAHPFPFIRNLGYGLALRLSGAGRKKGLMGLVLFPEQLPGFVVIPQSSKDTQTIIVSMRDLVDHYVSWLYPGFNVTSRGYFQVIRDTEIELQEEAEDLVRHFETVLKRRQRGEVIQLFVDQRMSKDIKRFLMREFELDDKSLLSINSFMRLTRLFQIAELDRPELKFKPFVARYPQRVRDFGGDCFAAIRAKDFVVHHPFESFDVVVHFLKQAANDPAVLSIKQTLYRTSNDSPIIRALCDAAEAGKSVTAIVELKARFDEAANIRWSRDLERAGVQVVYGFFELKTHAKVSLVTRKESDTLVSYAHYGTGNYHPNTAKIYTDLSFFTSDQVLTRDANILFNYMTSYVPPTRMEKLKAAPLNLRETLLAHIEKEAKAARKGKPAHIWAKMNSLVDPKLIDAFYRASQAGVQIRLSIRGICCLRPGVAGLSANIRVISIIGRYLEHSRIYCFSGGGEMRAKTSTVYISSADLMQRNLDRRVETLVPIENDTVKRQIVDQIMQKNFSDTCHAWELLASGQYRALRDNVDTDDLVSSHEYFMNNPSLSGRGSALTQASAILNGL